MEYYHCFYRKVPVWLKPDLLTMDNVLMPTDQLIGRSHEISCKVCVIYITNKFIR